MPAQELSHRLQPAVLWLRNSLRSDAYGQPIIIAPVDIMVRWNDTYNEIRTPLGATVTIEADLVVDRDIPVGSLLWKGRMVDLVNIQDPIPNIMQVYSFKGVPDVKARNTYRTCQLMRYKDQSSLPRG